MLSTLRKMLTLSVTVACVTLNAQADVEQFVKHWEGFRSHSYKDAGEVWTIGWGTTSASPCLTHDLNAHSEINKLEADTLLQCHLEWVRAEILTMIEVELPHVAVDAVVSFAYNVGLGAFSESTLLQKLNRGDFHGAASEFDRWVYCDGKILRGLKRRRAAEKQLFLSAF